MTLRLRLFMTSALIAVPLAVAWFLLDSRLRLASRVEELRRSVEADLAGGLRERCEANPPRGDRPGRGGGARNIGRDSGRGRGRGIRRGGVRANVPYEYFAYDADGRPGSSAAPPLPEERDTAAARTYWAGASRGVSLVVPLGGDGACVFLLARIPPHPGELRTQIETLVLVVCSVFGAVWIAGGPVVVRLRRLEAGVGQSAALHYARPVVVEGRDEIAALARAFNEAGQRVRGHLVDVQAREDTLRTYVANLTHDVAIPLTVLQGHLSELDHRLAGLPADRDRVRACVQEAHYMASLLRNLGVAATLDVPHASTILSVVDVSALVERVVARHRPMARAAEVSLDVAVPDPPLEASTDSTLFERALDNLVDNAIRYHHAGGQVAVLLDRVGNGFVLTVTDDGPGVSDEELTQLTVRWFRGADARTRRPDGKGLGLAIATESLARLGLTLTFHKPAEGGLQAEIRAA